MTLGTRLTISILQRSLFGDHTADKMTLGSRLSFYKTVLQEVYYDLVLSPHEVTARKSRAGMLKSCRNV